MRVNILLFLRMMESNISDASELYCVALECDVKPVSLSYTLIWRGPHHILINCQIVLLPKVTTLQVQ